VVEDGLKLVELADGVTLEEIAEKTEAKYTVAEGLAA
jgi:3-oxoacid CoA-transferase subunit B